MSAKQLTTPQEWYDCVEAGAAAMRRPYALRQFRRTGIPRVTIYHLPAHEDCTAWTVYEVPGSRDYLLQTVIWRQAEDGRRMEDLMLGRGSNISPAPTLEETMRTLAANWFERQFRALASISLPLYAQRTVGLDGESFGVHIRSEFEVEWWCDGPPEWADLVRWTGECIDYFRKLPPASQAS
jgi:hypothetical protein